MRRTQAPLQQSNEATAQRCHACSQHAAGLYGSQQMLHGQQGVNFVFTQCHVQLDRLAAWVPASIQTPPTAMAIKNHRQMHTVTQIDDVPFDRG